MSLKSTLTQIGEKSPLAIAASYVAISMVVDFAAVFLPENAFIVLLVLLVWLVSWVLFFVIVTWFRDEDWLAAGFMLGVSSILVTVLSRPVAEAFVLRSIGPLVVAAPSAFLAVIVRGLIAVPLSGGMVALARWITARWKGEPPAAAHRRVASGSGFRMP
jgi:hypothetical protein